MRRVLKVLLPLLIVAGGFGGAGVLYHTRSEVPRMPPAERTWTVETVPATYGPAQETLRVFGEVVAGRDVEIRPLVAGRIVEVAPQLIEGGTVAEGDVLIVVDEFDYEAALAERRAERDEAEARLRELVVDERSTQVLVESDRQQVQIREREVERRERLLKSGAGTEKALEDARLALNESTQRLQERERVLATLEARILQQQAGIVRLDVAVRRAGRDLEQTRLTAPFDAIVVAVDAQVGKRVGVGDRVARLIDSRRLEARFYLGNSQYARLAGTDALLGREIEVSWRGATTDRPFTAVVDRGEGQFDSALGGVRLYASLPADAAASGLRPGAFVAVAIHGRAFPEVIRLPEQALHDNDIVYVVADGRLAARTIELVGREGTDVFVRGGLAQGEPVLVTRFPEIAPGLRVAVR